MIPLKQMILLTADAEIVDEDGRKSLIKGEAHCRKDTS